MLPSYYTCTSCRERFTFSQHDARYHFGSTPTGGPVADAALFTVPVRPGWCKACSTVCLVEDIAPLWDFERAYGVARTGRPVVYPVPCEFGLIEPSFQVVSFNGPGPGVYSAPNIRVYNGEGDLIGLMTWRNRETKMWDVVTAAYAESDED